MLKAEDAAFSRLIAYAAYQWPGYIPAAHHRLIARKLEAVERGEIKRLMIFMPPRHGKSMLASEFFPAWYMGRNPDHYVVAATYGQDLADDFGRKVKNQIEDPIYQQIFPGVSLSSDSRSVRRFHVNGAEGGFEHSTKQNGAYYAVGVGGPLTGRGAHLLLIDDPVKDRVDADSEISRKNIKAWYTSTAYTRLMTGGAIIVIQCMVGDTRVLMADGGEALLRDIRPGDMVASHESGVITARRVLNWASQGVDSVFEIRTKSGKMARANERHPFLVERNGSQEWVRLKNLRAGDLLVGTGASGEASHAPAMAVTDLSAQRGSAQPTTTNNDGQAGTGRHQPPPSPVSPQRSSTDMVCLQRNTEPCTTLKEDAARSASSLQARTCGLTGAASFALTTITPAGRCEPCCATTATSLSDTGKQKPCCAQPLTTFGITLDEIVSITPCGREEVFDIQVEGSENFIANGLVSHNTRWHEDDLAGWLLKEHSFEGWDVLSLPALQADGTALWPEKFPVERLERIRQASSTVGNGRDWSALYQQSPSPDEGTFFQRDWFKTWNRQSLPPLNYYGTSDYAVTDGRGDYTVHRVWGIAPNGDVYRVDGWKGQTASNVWIDKMLDLVDRYQPLAWFGESGVIRNAIEPMLTSRMREREIHCRMEWLSSIHDKPTRARGFQARAAAGRVYFEPGADLDEFLRFPAGANDDDVDTASMIGRAIDMAHPAIVAQNAKPKPRDSWDRAFQFEDDTADSWKIT